MSDEFDLWYYGSGEDKGYPRKEARGDARKAFKAARKAATMEELIEGRRLYARKVRDTERQFIKLPATWLRAECWADEHVEEQRFSDPWDRAKWMDEFKKRNGLKLVK